MELAIGPEEGISYLTDKGANVSLLQSFFSISILTSMTCCELKGMTRLFFELSTEQLGNSVYTAVIRVLTQDTVSVSAEFVGL